MANTRHIPDDTLKALIARSGGHCQNPECNRDLFPFIADGMYKSIKEAAHIISFSEDGPRGNRERPQDSHDFDNVILLCPTCHTLVDKFSTRYPSTLLHQWKAQHEARLRQCFNAHIFEDRKGLRQVIEPLLRANKSCWSTYGPESSLKGSLLSDAPDMWEKAVLQTILPNNRTLLAILRANTHLLNERELELVEQFSIHKDGFEYNHLSGNKNSSVPMFPRGLAHIGEGELHA